MARIIQKFGGSSLAGVERVRAAAERIARTAKEHQVVVVLSAQGKTTDGLLAQAGQYGQGSGISFRREMDQLLACGEQMSVALCALMLLEMGVPAVSLTGWQAGFYAEGDYQDALPAALISDRIERELERGKVVLVAGFQAINDGGDIVTLGRGGSDTTAVALCHFLHGDRCQIFTDVDGVYTADPHTDPTAKKLPEVSYERMLDMARNGAKVLHDRCVELAMRYHIEIEVLSSFMNAAGTLVHQ